MRGDKPARTKIASGVDLLVVKKDIAVLKKVRYGGESMPMPYALCPMPYEHLMLLRKAIRVMEVRLPTTSQKICYRYFIRRTNNS
jgi:hypothetical protein